MRTVKEVSELTGISVRTLHYYDEIGLLKPTKCSEAGYRLYDDKALETLQQILFFREFDMPLKEIRSIMENPDLDRKQILGNQRELLELKRKRMERMISSIDDILKGENKMDFEVFSRTEIEEMYDDIINSMTQKQLEKLQSSEEGLESYRQKYIENAGIKHSQEHMAKMVEWYGKDNVKEFVAFPAQSKIGKAYSNRIDEIYRKLQEKKQAGISVTEFEVKALIGELDFVMRQFMQLDGDAEILKNLADSYWSENAIAEKVDMQYGEGMADYIAEAIEGFCG